MASKIGVKIVTSLYSHGSYDWIISFMAIDIRQAKKFTEQVKIMYSEYIADLHLLETLFFIKKTKDFIVAAGNTAWSEA